MTRSLTSLLFFGLVAVGCLPIDDSLPDAAVRELPSDSELLAARPYHLAAPSTYDASRRWPLLIGLHGYGGSARDFEARWSLDAFAEERGMFIAIPNGLVDSRGNRAWHPSAVHSPSYDVEYLTAIIRSLKAKYAIDPARVYVFGHSQGAHMTHRMGCDAAGEVAAFVSLAGQVTKRPNDCVPEKPVSALEIHGTADEAIGYYGDVQRDPPDPSVPSAHETIATWARANQCAGELKPTGATLDLSYTVDGSETFIEAYGACPPGIATELWTMNEVYHWPEPTPEFMTFVAEFLEAHHR